ncbi:MULTISPECIES: alpha/beta fold hydrolase [unclassified Clostridium]|uniref:alpha/beta fold hydrolase n=1 Tax=unclassified Clostridium TaxID=2614128 RepID=UPI0025C2CED1|nr:MULTISPECIES: alpha/beta hydrolase [unclassified Clostridium]
MIRLTEIEGRKVEYLIKGNGEKTVAIMVGMGCSIYDWLNIIEDISQYANVIAIHRPGVGNSEPHIEGSTTAIASKDLYSLIKKLDIKEKIILVGHSYGGLCVQHFSRLYPEKVEGAVLVDSSSVDGYKFNELELPVSDENESDEAYINLWTTYSKYTKEQLKDEIKPTLSKEELKLPYEIQQELLEFNIRPEFYRTQLSELIDLRNGGKEIKSAGKFPNVPLKILIRDPEYSINQIIETYRVPREEAERVEELWQRLSKELKELSNKSELIIVENSDHCINESRPDAVIAAIKELLI